VASRQVPCHQFAATTGCPRPPVEWGAWEERRPVTECSSRLALSADRRRRVVSIALLPKLVAGRAYAPRFAEYGPSLCVTTLPYGSRPRRSRASTLGTTWQSATVWRGPGTEHRDGDPSLNRCTSPERREWASAHAAEHSSLSASSPPSRRAHVSDDRRPCQGRSPATSAESVTKISSSDSRDPLAPVRAGELDDWRGRPTKSSGRMPSQLAECQRTGCTGPTIVEAERDSQQPAASSQYSLPAIEQVQPNSPKG
jgi:hypothetical protein